MPRVPYAYADPTNPMVDRPKVAPENLMMAVADMDAHGALFQDRSKFGMKSPTPQPMRPSGRKKLR